EGENSNIESLEPGCDYDYLFGRILDTCNDLHWRLIPYFAPILCHLLSDFLLVTIEPSSRYRRRHRSFSPCRIGMRSLVYLRNPLSLLKIKTCTSTLSGTSI